MNRIVLAVIVLFNTSAVFGHDLKVFASQQTLPDTTQKTTVYLSWGHRMPVDGLVDAATLVRYQLCSPDGKNSPLQAAELSLQANSVGLDQTGVYQVVACKKASVYTYVFGEDGNRQLKRGPKPDHAGANIDSATRYQQCAKALIVVGAAQTDAPKPIGLPVEIVPLDGPTKWTANADIRFQILQDGKPVPTVEVRARNVGFKPDDAWSYATESNRNGEFSVRPGQPGAWVVKAVVKKPTRGATRE